METVLIIIIVGLAFTYLSKRFYNSLQKTKEPQCGCGCTSCPSEKNCDEPAIQPAAHIK